MLRTEKLLKILRMPLENEAKQMINMTALPEIDITSNKTYDKIDAIYVNPENVQDSLLVLRVTAFSVMHIVTFGSCKETLATMTILGQFNQK